MNAFYTVHFARGGAKSKAGVLERSFCHLDENVTESWNLTSVRQSAQRTLPAASIFLKM